MNVYVATSWRNERQPEIVKALREEGHTVYDFRAPVPGDNGFHWSEIDPEWKKWTPAEYRLQLDHPTAHRGFSHDMRALDTADAVVLVMPCGRSAHLELGYAAGQGKHTVILLSEGEPELMYKMVDCIAVDMGEVTDSLEQIAAAMG